MISFFIKLLLSQSFRNSKDCIPSYSIYSLLLYSENEFPALYSELKKTWVKDEIPYVPTSKQLRLSKKISSLFAKALSNMFSSFREHCITDMSQKNTPITVFIKESFLESVPREDLNWYATLLETQTFFHYMDNRLRKMDRIISK